MSRKEKLRKLRQKLSQKQKGLLKKRLRASGQAATAPDIIPPRLQSGAVPLSFSQKRMWVLNQLEPNSPAYNESQARRLSGALDVERLKRSLSEIVRRHEMLRTKFALVDGQPMQMVESTVDWHLDVVDLSDLSHGDATQREVQVAQLLADSARRPFDLSQEPPWRATLIRLAPQEHLFLLTVHHIVSDGWSMAVFVRELTALYRAFSAGYPSAPLPELPIQYADFSCWQHQYLQGETRQKLLTYWRNALQNLPTLAMPTDHRRPIQQTFNGASQPFMLSREISAGLQQLSQQEGVTLFMTLLAAFQTLLNRYTGQEDIVIGSPIANRNRPELEGLIGFFVNTLVLRTDLSGQPTFRELLQRVRNVTLSAYAHQDLPFELIVEELQPVRDLSRNPLFQIMFVLQNMPSETLKLSDLSLSPVLLEESTAKLDLNLWIEEKADGLQGTIKYNTDLFEHSTIERMVGHLQSLLTGIVLNPDQPITHLPLLTESEKQQLLVEWNETQVDYPQAARQCIHQLFEQHAAAEDTSEAIALIFQYQQLTYRELNARANQLAHYLIAQGVGPDVLVGICIPRSLEMVVGLLGILKAGGAYVPLDPSLPDERCAFMIEDAQVEIVLTEQHLAERFAQVKQIICLDTDWTSKIAAQSSHNPPGMSTPENLAYVIFTSGSTGRPKGVPIEHRQLHNYVAGIQEALDLPTGASFATVSTLAADLGNTAIFPTLCTGGTLLVISQAQLSDPELMADIALQYGMDCLKITPSHLVALMSGSRPAAVLPRQLLVLGGEASSWQLIKRIRSLAPSCRIVNHYGPTESTIGVLTYPIEQDATELTTIPIGRPIANTQAYILDRYRQPVPIGVPGELYIGGAQVGRGYLNRPQLTSERFIANPFSQDTESGRVGEWVSGRVGEWESGRVGEWESGRVGEWESGRVGEWESGRVGAIADVHKRESGRSKIERLYKTGDLVRYLPDGKIEFLGRTDYQVKIRGFRVELGEIESTLRQCVGVREALVVVREQPSGSRLVAYVVGEVPSRAQLTQKLPDYMIPSAFVLLDAMPLTPNGKIDRRALPAAELSVDSAQVVLPRTPTEEILAAIWQELLGVEHGRRIGIHDNFFEIGGHSLLATQVVSRIRQSLQVELPLRRLFSAPTIAELASQLTASRTTESALPPLEALDDIRRTEPLPLSFAQQRIWFLGQLEGVSDAYNIPAAFRLDGPLDVAAVKTSCRKLEERHEALRTTFPIVDGQARQQINAPSVKLELIDLSDLPTDQQEAEVARLARQEAKRSFDLINGPLWSITLLRLSENSHVLLPTMHHIISDGWSMGILIREFSALYAQQADRLPDLPVQYADFAVWQREWLQGEVLKAQFAYWKKQLADAPPLLTLPTDHARPAVQRYRGDRLSVTLAKSVTDELASFSQKNSTTLFMTLQAAFAVLLSRYSDQEDVLIGTPIANRQIAEIENMAGVFINMLVLRNDLSSIDGQPPTFRDVLERVRQVALDAYQHQALPFELLVDMLQPERSLSHSPLFQVMFVYNKRQEAFSFSDVTVRPIEVEYPVTKFDLTLEMEEREEGLMASWDYNTDLFERTTIERMAEHFQTLLAGIVANPDQPIALLPLLTEREKHQLLVEWNDTAADYPEDKCIHQLFEEQVARTPEAIAVVFADQQVTYRELNARANQLAHYLIAQGVGADVLVGLCVKRSVEMMVGLLGILKAGGAYVPLDPSLPAERLQFMLEDAKINLLLTHSRLLETTPQVVARFDLDQEWTLIGEHSTLNPITKVSSDDLAYCIYTSGSTGKPKGTLIVHKGLINYLTWCIQAYPVANGCGSPVNSSIGFDATITSLFSPLLVGKQVILLPEEEEIEALAHVLGSDHELSLVKITPAHLEVLNQLWPTNNSVAYQCQAFIVGGEALFKKHLAFLQTHESPIRVINEYGPTETVVGCCVYEVSADSLRASALPNAIPIGRPIANTQLYILDRHLQPVPIGVPGELYIGGAGVARGYLNRPQLTKEKFIPNPFSQDTESGRAGEWESGRSKIERLYKTGDLCRYILSDGKDLGHIEFLGRTDYQVKIRGFRIELGEIEANLRQCVGVREAVVVVRKEASGPRLVAYVTFDDMVRELKGGSTELPSTGSGAVEGERISALRAQLANALPDYMIPLAFVSLDAMPLTPNGKIDRRALPAPEYRNRATQLLLPRTPIETILAAIWQDVLGIEQVGVTDNFFQLGGDSIISIQIVSRAREAGLQFTPKALFQYQTIAELASAAGQHAEARELQKTHAEQGIVTGTLPLTPIQHWFLEQTWQEPHHFNQSVWLELSQEVNPTWLSQAVQALLTHHDALRLRFERQGGSWLQEIVAPEPDVPFEVIDLSTLKPSEQVATQEKWANQLQASLNLSQGPLMRVALFQGNEGNREGLPLHTNRLLIIIHHLAVDGVSWRILLEDLERAYQQVASGSSITLPAKSTSFKQWSTLLNEAGTLPAEKGPSALQAERDQWAQLRATPPLPVDYQLGPNDNASAAHISTRLTRAQTEALLNEVPAVYHTQINDLLLTALLLAVNSWTGQPALLLNLEGHGRESLTEFREELFEVDLSRTVGWFTSIFPVRLELTTSDLGETIKRIKEQLRSIPNRGIGYGILRYLSDLHMPEIEAQVSFNYLGQFDQNRSGTLINALAAESSGIRHSPLGSRTHLLDINSMVIKGQLQVDWTYSQNFHRAQTIQKLANRFIDALQALIAHCQKPEAGGYTPSDFSAATVNQKRLDKLMAKIKRRS